MGASGTDNFCLRWNDFAENVSGAFKDLRAESDFFDVTLACSDSGARTLPAHKVILSACSNFFKTTFRQQMNANKHPNPYIYLRGVTYNDLASILDFIYNGEVNVAQEDLNSFLAVAEELQIKGLTNRDNTSGAENNSNSKRPKIRQANPDTPPVKKVRRSSPVPSSSSSSGAAASQIVTPVIDDKEVVNIKDDPEAVLASTSAVNPDDSADFGGEEYDESYDNYYEDEGAELGEGAEGSDGTKGLLFNGKYFKVVSQSDGINEARCQFCAPNKRPLRGNVGVSSNFVRHLKMQHPVQHAMYVEEKGDK